MNIFKVVREKFKYYGGVVGTMKKNTIKWNSGNSSTILNLPNVQQMIGVKETDYAIYT